MTRWFLLQLLLVIGNFYFDKPKINRYLSNTLWIITFNNYTQHTCKVFSCTMSFVFTSHNSQSLRFLSFSWSNIEVAWFRTIFWRTVLFRDTSICVARTIRESYLHKTHQKNLHSKFHNALFLKILCLLYTQSLEKNLMKQNVNDDNNHKLYNEPWSI